MYHLTNFGVLIDTGDYERIFGFYQHLRGEKRIYKVVEGGNKWIVAEQLGDFLIKA